MESNEAKVVAIFKALRVFVASFRACLIMESDTSNAVSWATSSSSTPSRFKFLFNEIKALSSLDSVEFKHIGRAANDLANSLAKQWIDRFSPFFAFL